MDREWVFFEAGAAFGRRVPYAPILIDVSPSELPTSIGGYQGVMVRDVERMRELMEDLAKAVGSRSKSHFSQRHGRLVKAVDGYGKKEDETSLHLEKDADFRNDHWRAGREQEWVLTVENTQPSVELEGKKLSVKAVKPLSKFFVAFQESEVRLLFVLSSDPEAVTLPGLTKPGRLEWLQFVPYAP